VEQAATARAAKLLFSRKPALSIPTRLFPDQNLESQQYLRWRADQVTQTLADLAWFARSLNPQVQISANNFDAVMRPSYVTYGIDLPALAQVQDLIMIEDYGLPHWQPSIGEKKRLPSWSITH
jgi:hypothetical protein